MQRLKCVLITMAVAVVVCVVAAGPASAAKGGNRDNAHACQQGGHAIRFEAETGRPFNNAGDCASHGAQGLTAAILDLDNSEFYGCSTSGTTGVTCFWGTLTAEGLAAGASWKIVD